MAEDRHATAGRRADHGVVGGHVPPGHDAQALLPGDALDGGDRSGARLGAVVRAGEEDQADGVGAGSGQGGDLLTEEGVGHRHEQARSVSRALLGAHGAAVVQTLKDVQCVDDHGVSRDSAEAGDEAHATGIVLLGRVVESPAAGSCRDGRGRRGVLHADRPSVGQSRRPAP